MPDVATWMRRSTEMRNQTPQAQAMPRRLQSAPTRLPAIVPSGLRGTRSALPQRQAGGLVEIETKSRAGPRIVSVPAPLLNWLNEHQDHQNAERLVAADMWQHGDWTFAEPTGRPIDPRRDYQEWRNLLTAASVRPARLHDARHTAATMSWC
jgi:hypothetical protein